VSAVDFGPYRLVRRMAAGGTAEVFLALCEDGTRSGPVVIKRLFAELARHAEVLAAFRREADLLALLQHPAIPRLHDRGEHDGRWYIAMDHVRGVTLAAGAEANARCPLDAAVAVAHQMADVLQHVHGQQGSDGRPLNIVHCDVNPSNVVAQPDGSVVLLDFGVARTADDVEPPAAGRGTLRYMAPEQITGGAVDARTDLHALGVVLHELSAGQVWRTGPDVQVMTRIVEEDAPPPSALRTDYPVDLEQLVMACLERDPSQRPQSAAEVTRALASVAARHGWELGAGPVAGWLGDPSEPGDDVARH
jgi:eukaryotic-like serine/threonine-protein kinase